LRLQKASTREDRPLVTESAEQMLGRHIRDMGPELGEIYDALLREVARLHAKWNQYRQLYGRSPERVAFLNKVAGHFFRTVQDTLMDDILLNLGRLADPPKSTGKENLTLQRLPNLVPDAALRNELEALVRAACKACDDVARTSRNQRIAHTDLACTVGRAKFDPIPPRAHLEVALKAIRAVLHRLETNYWQSETAYEHCAPAGGDAHSLLYCRWASGRRTNGGSA
jgi:hypothetical protein